MNQIKFRTWKFFQVQAHNGSIRTQETTVEQIQSEASNRAVENQYSFV